MVNYVGRRFGRLVVTGLDHRNAWGTAYVGCTCDCGHTKVVLTTHLKSGNVRSCGCLAHEVRSRLYSQRGPAAFRRTHGLADTPTYRSWEAMRQRCGNPNASRYKDYGGRGITVCERWQQSFEAFYADMGERPAGLTLERANNDGNYEPSNCKWATRLEQAHNKRVVVRC